VLDVFGVEVWITETIVNTWVLMLVLTALAVFVRIKLKRFENVPKGFQNVIESLVEMFDGAVRGIAGDRLMYLGNWFFMVAAFILISSFGGMVGLRPPTADWATTFAFALVTFMMVQVLAIRHRRGKYIKSFFEPNFVFFPLNLIGELARPISLSFRLFGNVLTGLILMPLLYSLFPVYLRFIIPAALHAYFDVFTGVLQTYVFCVLSLAFISTSSAVPVLEEK